MNKYVKDCPAFIVEDLSDDLDAIFQRIRSVCPFSSLNESDKDKFMCKLYHFASLVKILKLTVYDFLNEYGKDKNSN